MIIHRDRTLRSRRTMAYYSGVT